MFRLATMLYSMISTTLAGSLIVVALVMRYDSWVELLVAAALGALIAVPASFYIAQAIVTNKK